MKYSYWVVARVSYNLSRYHDYNIGCRFDLDHKFNSKDIDECAKIIRNTIIINHPIAQNIEVVITFFGLLED